MFLRTRGIALSVFAVALGAFAATASATTIDPLTLEQLVEKADFVGVVEGTVAGGIVAKYRVVESLKGSPKTGSELALEIAVNYWQPQFPIARVGEKYFVTAYKSPPNTMMSTTSGGPVPLWWRRIPSDYRLPLFQGMYRLADDGPPFKAAFDEIEYDTLDKFLKRVAKFVSATDEERECVVLKSAARKRLGPDRYSRGKPQPPVVEEALKKVKAAKDVASVVAILLETARQWPDAQRAVVAALGDGGKATWKAFHELPRDDRPFSEGQEEEIAKRLHPRPRPALEPQPDEEFLAPLPESKLAELRKALGRQDEGEAFRAMTILAKHDPAPAAAFLVKWRNRGGGWPSSDAGYFVGSSFAYLCGKDRPLHLKSLLKADDPFIRVAGAVYLCFEDEKQGVDELKKLTSLEGDPGAWAALNIARRGDASAVPRALKVFQEPGESNMSGVLHGNLQKRLTVLLSNSAKASGINQPVEAESRDPEETEESRIQRNYEAHVKWWDENKSKVKLTDPWLELLAKQKVD